MRQVCDVRPNCHFTPGGMQECRYDLLTRGFMGDLRVKVQGCEREKRGDGGEEDE